MWGCFFTSKGQQEASFPALALQWYSASLWNWTIILHISVDPAKVGSKIICEEEIKPAFLFFFSFCFYLFLNFWKLFWIWSAYLVVALQCRGGQEVISTKQKSWSACLIHFAFCPSLPLIFPCGYECMHGVGQRWNSWSHEYKHDISKASKIT